MRLPRLAASLFVLLAFAGVATAAPLDPPPGFTAERVVMVFRHGVRSPLPGEAAAAAYAPAPFPTWSTPPEHLTPHGREALRLVGGFDRELLGHQGLLPASGCPAPETVLIWTNTAERTIASGEALAEGLAPGCGLMVGHKPAGTADPLFESSASGAPFDPAAAIASIQAYTGGLGQRVADNRPALDVFEDILGCRTPGEKPACDLAALPSRLAVSRDGRGLKLEGPIALASGTAQVFLLQYAEGLPMDQVGWGRATPERIAEASRLHALLFDVYDRSPYMARRTAFALGPRVAGLLTDDGEPRVSLLIGHDNNIAALTSLLQAPVVLDGYAPGDPPPGGALGFERLRERRTGRIWIRLFYQSQTLDQMRALAPLSAEHPPLLVVLRPACAKGREGLCPIGEVAKALRSPTLLPLWEKEGPALRSKVGG